MVKKKKNKQTQTQPQTQTNVKIGPEKSHYAHFDMKAQTNYQQFNYQ